MTQPEPSEPGPTQPEPEPSEPGPTQPEPEPSEPGPTQPEPEPTEPTAGGVPSGPVPSGPASPGPSGPSGNPPVSPNPSGTTTSISGTLENSETDTGSAGEIRAYRKNADNSYTLLGTTTAASNGRFSMTFNHRGNFDLQARLKDGADDKSYIRTLSLSSGRTGLTIRAVPYTDLAETNTVSFSDGVVSIPEFKTFMRDVNKVTILSGGGIRRDTFDRWNLDDLNGIEILRENPTSNTGTFSTTQQNYIESVIKASDDGKILFNGRTINVQKDSSLSDQNTNKKYTVSGSVVRPNRGWIVIVPEYGVSYDGAATTWDIGNDGFVDFAWIGLKSPGNFYQSSGDTITHELAHVTLYPGGDVTMGHTSRISFNKSITAGHGNTGDTVCTKPCSMDKKAAKLIYEPTFPVGTSYGEILGTAWHS